VLGWNPFGSGALIYADWFTRDAIHACGEASLSFPIEVFLGKNDAVCANCFLNNKKASLH
jgi:hypothetical protein